MDAQPQRLWRPEFFPLHHCNMLTTSGTKPLWQRDKAGAKVFLAERKQAPKIDPITPQSDHTLPLRKHFHSNLRRHTSETITPKYICLLWWRAVIPEREMCYCKWNLFRSLLSLSGKMCSDTAMGGSINFWNTESCAQKCWLSLLDTAAALCLCQQPPVQLCGRTQREGAAIVLHAACLWKDIQEGRLGRRCDVCLSFLTLSRLGKWDCKNLLLSCLTQPKGTE